MGTEARREGERQRGEETCLKDLGVQDGGVKGVERQTRGGEVVGGQVEEDLLARC